MRKVNTNVLFPFLALVILIFTLSQRLFNVFPVGKLMDPFIGFIQNGNDRSLVRPLSVYERMNVTDSVHVYFDDRKIPHIYASQLQDAWFAQGYVTASLRLWQMDFLSYVAAGRLSEIFGSGYLD